jgi:DNA topoisomerase-1
LRFVSDTQPGIRRYRRGKGYLYTMPASASPTGRPTPIHDEATLARIKSLDIPDSWRQVWISPQPGGHLQATGRDSRGRRQTRYHPHWRTFREETRFDQMLRFSEILPTIRSRVESDIDLPGMPRERILAILIRLMDSAGSSNGRVRKATAEIETAKHTKSQANSTTWFQINGKGKKYKIDIGDHHLNRVVCEYVDLPGFELFQYTDSHGKRACIGCSDINDYVHSSARGEFTARDFRTWCGSLLAFEFLCQSQLPKATDEANKRVIEAVRRVSNQLSHTPAVCLKCLIHPAIIESYHGGTIQRWLDPANGANNDQHRHADFRKLALHERCLYCLLKDWAERSGSATA